PLVAGMCGGTAVVGSGVRGHSVFRGVLGVRGRRGAVVDRGHLVQQVVAGVCVALVVAPDAYLGLVAVGVVTEEDGSARVAGDVGELVRGVVVVPVGVPAVARPRTGLGSGDPVTHQVVCVGQPLRSAGACGGALAHRGDPVGRVV